LNCLGSLNLVCVRKVREVDRNGKLAAARDRA
jgi:hypothetical protein